MQLNLRDGNTTMPIPPLDLNQNNDQYKRLTSDLLKGYWNMIREDHSFPSISDIHPEHISDIWDNCFLVEANNETKKEDYKYIYLGERIIEAYGQDLTGMKIDTLVSPQAEHLAEEYERVLALKHPIESEGVLTCKDAPTIKYRQILLPLGDDGININAILGGMSYKLA